jgi:hypothetical protein
MTKSRSRKPPEAPKLPEIVDEPGMAERFRRTLRNLLNTPPKPRSARKSDKISRSGAEGKKGRGQKLPLR